MNESGNVECGADIAGAEWRGRAEQEASERQ